MKIPSWVQKLCHDTATRVFAAGIIAVAGIIGTYFLGWWPAIHQWLISPITLPTWQLLVITAVAVLSVPFVISKIFPDKTGVKKLIAESMDKNVPVTMLLRKAKLVAKKIDDKGFQEWAEKELSGGYDLDLPDYRKSYGTLKALNPYRGWETVQFRSAEMRELMTAHPNGQDIGSLEETLLRVQDGPLTYNHSPSQKQIIFNAFNNPDITDFHLEISPSAVQRILDVVRNRVHEWAVGLQ
jgi:hypothetical protein